MQFFLISSITDFDEKLLIKLYLPWYIFLIDFWLDYLQRKNIFALNKQFVTKFKTILISFLWKLFARSWIVRIYSWLKSFSYWNKIVHFNTTALVKVYSAFRFIANEGKNRWHIPLNKEEGEKNVTSWVQTWLQLWYFIRYLLRK